MKTEEKKTRSGVKKSLEKRRRLALALRSRWRREEESLWRRKSLEKRRRFALALESCWREDIETLWREKLLENGDCGERRTVPVAASGVGGSSEKSHLETKGFPRT